MKIFFALFLSSLSLLHAESIRLQTKIHLSQDKEILENAAGLAILESSDIIISDTITASIKTYDSRGRFLNRFGRRGQGPNEFSVPGILDYFEGKLAIYDWERDKVFIYSQNKTGQWAEIDRFYGSFDDLKITDNGYLLSGPKADKADGWFRGFFKHSGNGAIELLFPFNEMYEIGRGGAINSNGFREIADIGIQTYSDFDAQAYYSVWAGALVIHRRDRVTGKTSKFGQPTAAYRPPKVTPALTRAKRERKLDMYYKEVGKFSTLRKVIASKKLVIVLFMNSDPGRDYFYSVAQIYSKDGRLLGESALTESKCPHTRISCYFDRKDESLYFISTAISPDGEPDYSIHRYVIIP
jgi:hypothetical protein